MTAAEQRTAARKFAGELLTLCALPAKMILAMQDAALEVNMT